MHFSVRPLITGLRSEWSHGASAGRALVSAATRCINEVSPYNSSLAIARALLALSTLLTVLLTPSGTLFLRSPDNPDGVVCDALAAEWSLFCAAGGATPLTALLVVAVTVSVLTGYFPAITAIPHWWVAWSLNVGSPIRDGGDQVAAVLSLLLIPLLLLDRRRNHWAPDQQWGSRSWATHGTAWAALVLVWVQAAVRTPTLPSRSSLSPSGPTDRALVLDPGTELPSTSTPPSDRRDDTEFARWRGHHQLRRHGSRTLRSRPPVRPTGSRRIALPILLLFHLCIGVMFGLWSFFLSMAALLVLYLRVPTNDGTDQ